MDQRRYLDQIFDVLNAASFTAIAIAAIMLVAAALLIATTIRLSAFSRRRELGIMRLVGASNRFIQTPFILEGVFAGLIGSLLAGGAVVAIVQFFVQGYLAQSCRSRSSTSATPCSWCRCCSPWACCWPRCRPASRSAVPEGLSASEPAGRCRGIR